MADQWDAPPAPGMCPWCSATNVPDARHCSSCGAAIAQRADLGGVVVPGVTGVDPNLAGFAASLSSSVLRTQGTTNALFAATQVNATAGLAAAAAVLGQDAVKGMLGLSDADLDTVGKPSEVALLAVEKLERDVAAAEVINADADAHAEPPPAEDPWADLPNG